MRVRRLGSRFSLLAKFASVSLLAIVALGLVVGRSFQLTIEEQGKARATESAALIARAGIQPRIPTDDLRNEFSDDAMRATDAKLHSRITQQQIESVTVWNSDLDVIYSTNHDRIGESTRENPNLGRALDGH